MSSCMMASRSNSVSSKCNRGPSRSSADDTPIPRSKRLTKPRSDKLAEDKLCQRPKWVKTDSAPRVEYIINYKFPQLPSVSSRYQKWISKAAKSQTDTNLSASRFSSKRENQAKIAALPIPRRQDPCPCHCYCA